MKYTKEEMWEDLTILFILLFIGIMSLIPWERLLIHD